MHKIYATVLLALTAGSALAQSGAVSGTVTDGFTGKAISGVTVVEKGTSNGASANDGGRFSIVTNNSLTDTLIVSAIGYETITVAVGGQSSLDISLSQSATGISETVVTALGIRRDKSALGYAVQRLDARDIAEVKSVNFLDNLSGKVAGVTVTPGPTGVGSTSRITLRGERSFTNNNPLFVVDGVPINNNTAFNIYDEQAAGFQGVDFGNGASEVNPDDIQSVSVLKGPASAALYGTRASNGVIVITTKDGRKTNGIGVSFNSTMLVEGPFKLPKFQNQYGQGNSGKFEYKDGLGGGVNDNISYSYGPELDKGVPVKQFDGPATLPDGTVVRGGDVAVRGTNPITPTDFNSHPNSLRNFYRTGLTTINNLAISAGNEKGNYRLSYTDLRSKSYIPGTNLDRKTANLNLNFAPTEKLHVNASGSYVNTTSDNRPANGYGSENVNYSLVAWGPRSLDIGAMRDRWQPGLEGRNQFSFNTTYFDNPYLTLENNTNSLDRHRLFGNIRAQYDFTEKISLAVRTGIDYSQEQRAFRRNFSSNRFINGAYAEQNVFYRETNTDVLASYNDQFGDVSLNVSAGGNRLDQEASYRQVQALNLAQPGVFSLNNAATPLQQYQFLSSKRINSIYGFVKLGYKNYLFLDITGRNDWSSALATPVSAANTAFFYPSFSGSFLLSNVVKMPRNVSYAQLRASYAQVGNDTNPYQTAGVFNAKTPYASQPTLSENATIANSALLPEKISAVEVGADVRFFKDRLGIDFTYYNSRSRNQIIQLPISAATGYSQQVVNGATVQNKGFEIVANITPVRHVAFRWDATLNFSQNRAYATGLPAGIDRLTLGYNRVYDNIQQTVYVQVAEGGRIGDLYGTGYKKNVDGQLIVDNKGNFIVDNTLKKLGNYNADFNLGLTNNFSYKAFRLGFLLDWRQGGILVSRTLALAGVAGQLKETANRPAEGIIVAGVVNTGTPEAPVYTANTTPITAESYYRQYYDRNHEENSVYNASFLKLRQVSLSYTFGTDRLLRSFLKGLKGIELSLIGRNLFAFSHIPHFDPEQMAAAGNGFVNGVEDMSYPTTRSVGFKLGLNL